MDRDAYTAELERQNRGRLRVGWVAAAAAQLAFWAVDRVMVPAERWRFLLIRLAMVGLGSLAVAAALRTRSAAGFRAGLQAAAFLIVAVVPVMTFFTGGFGAFYTYFVPPPVYAGAVLVAWSVADGALYVGAVTGLYLVGNGVLLARGVGRPEEALAGVLLVGSTGVFAFLTILFADRARRAEHALRHDLERANAALAASLASLRDRESRLATLGGMTSAIVHDLRNPLSAVLSLSRSALEDVRAAGGPAELAADLEVVVTSGGRLRAMLEEMLAFARRGAPAPSDERVEVAGLVREVAGLLAPSLRSAGVALALRVEGAAGARVLADREALRRVLENLVRNAAEAIGLRPGPGAAGGGPRGHVTVELVAGAREVVVRVVDDGCGIPEALRATLFEPFATAGKAHGTGLGLMMARHVARTHGGELLAEPPPPGGGAAFRLTLPLAP